MDSKEITTVVELGTTSLRCVVGKVNNDESLEILDAHSSESRGIHNGVIINLDEAAKSIRSCLSNVEKKLKIYLRKINIVIEPQEFLCTRISKSKVVGGAKIQKEDISYLLKEAKKQTQLNNPKHSIIHIFNYNYFADGKEFEKEPIGAHADFFKHELTIISSPKNLLKNINQALIDCDIETGKFISGSYALGMEHLSNSDFKLGATIIDIGYEKTSLAVFNSLALIHSATIPIGSNHITKDISRGCSLSLEDSENIKNTLGIIDSEHLDNKTHNNNLSEDLFKKTKFRKISKALVKTIVKSRIEEILHLTKKELFFSGLKMTAGKNIFILGGGANMPNLHKFSSEFFDCNVKIFKNSDNLKLNKEHLPKFKACLGAIKIIQTGFETEAIAQEYDQNKVGSGIFYKLFGKKT